MGKQYSTNAIQQRFNGQEKLKQQLIHQLKQSEKNSERHTVPAQAFYQKELNNHLKPTSSIDPANEGKNLLQELMQPEFTQAQLPYELKKQKRKRKRKRLHL